MKKRYFYLFLPFVTLLIVSSFFVFFNPSPVRALGIEKNARRWVCLNHNENFPTHRGDNHNTELSSANPAPLAGVPAYIFVCIGGTPDGGGGSCTTGSSTKDVEAIGGDNLSILSSKYAYKFEGMNPATNPVTPGGDGSIGKIIWQDSTKDSQNRIWMALQQYDPIAKAAGVAGGLQNSDFSFETASKKCVMLSWDPFGRVFDSQTLEPILGATVTLYYNKNYGTGGIQSFTLYSSGTVPNPITTKADGVFNFVVPDGEYKLELSTGIAQNMTELQSSYTKMYKDIYLADTGKTNMGGIIVEKGGAQHRDIPVPTRNTNTNAEVMEYLPPIQSNGVITIQGRTSHAFTKIIPQIKRVKNDKSVTIRDAEKYKSETAPTDPFSFSVEIDQSILENTPDYVDYFAGFITEKTDVINSVAQTKTTPHILSVLQSKINAMLNSVFVVHAVTRGNLIAVEPIPGYLEGYAYDGGGKIIPKATVGIYLKGAQKTYYETQADGEGHYSIGSEFIPPFNYELRYTKITGEPITASASTYIVDNHVYQANNNINTYTPQAATPKLIAQNTEITKNQPVQKTNPTGTSISNVNQKNLPGSKTISGATGRSVTAPNQTGGVSGSVFSNGMQGVVMIIVVIFVLILIGAGAFIMMKSKQQTPQY